MIKKLSLYCCVMMMLWTHVPAHAAEFFNVLLDVPVMPELYQVEEDAVVFDSPQGRIAEAYAIAGAGVNKQDIFAFYSQSLPQLGWAEQSQGTYVRDGERLDIHTFWQEQSLIVRLSLMPL